MDSICTVILVSELFAPILSSEWMRRFILAPVLASEGVRCNARRKIPAMDSTKAYSHCWDFLLAEAGMPLITLKDAIEDVIYILKIILQSKATIKLLTGKQ